VLSGSAILDDLAARAPVMSSLDTAPVTLDDVEVLQATFELPYSSRESLLPTGLHPTTPPLLVLLAWRVPASPWGPFTMAQARVSCRSGVRPRGFVVGCLADTPEAASGLARAWGLPAVRGRVTLERRYDRAELAAEGPDGPAAHLVALDPDPMSPDDVQFTVTTTLATTPRGLRLVQVEPEYEIRRVERIRPRLLAFEERGWGQTGLRPYHPVSATVAVGRVTVPPLRFLSRPDVNAFEGTEKV
jgi:hypothetical protein